MGQELETITYYNQTKFSNTFYLAQIALETYFAKLLFENNLSRIIYASSEFCFRQRLLQLEQYQIPSNTYLNTPFMSYYHTGGWEIDKRPGLPSPLLTYGVSDASVGHQLLKGVYVQATFDCLIFYNRDDDARVAYNTLLTSNFPSFPQFMFPGITYKGYAMDVPIILELTSLNYQPNIKEKDWLRDTRLIPISFSVILKTITFIQKPLIIGEPEESDEDNIYITKQVLLDFLTYKYGNRINEAYIDLEISASFDPAQTPLQVTLTVDPITETEATLRWVVNNDALSNYENNLTIIMNNYFTYTAPIRGVLDEQTGLVSGYYTLSNLSPGSLYNCSVWFKTIEGKLSKFLTSFTTLTQETPRLKGMIGYTF